MRKSYLKIPSPGSLMCDFYKVSHRPQYPDKTEFILATWIARSNKHYPAVDKVITVGIQGFNQKFLIDYFNEHFFDRPQDEVVAEYVRYCKFALFDPDPDYKHIADLHELGFIPLEIKSLPEGTRVPFGVPSITIQNTDPRFFWVTNYIETLASCELWPMSTTCTIADHYFSIMDKYAQETSSSPEFVPFQGHDFSMRGMYGFYASQIGSTGHLMAGYVGTDTAPAIAYVENYYNANMENGLVGCSVPATEHSVMCAGGMVDEFETYRRLVQDIYPTGIVSIVSDTWDLWHVVTNILPKLKDIIMAREGGKDSMDKVVIRPDSGDPVDIICGTSFNYNPSHGEIALEEHEKPRWKGLIELLWEIFGGTTNDKGFKELDPHIGAIYGDSITPERCEAICQRLKAKGFASTNVVFGIGSYTYQYLTRDSFGFAMKSTSAVIDGVDHMLFKDPVTDDGTKKSLKGACIVTRDEKEGELKVVDGLEFNHTEFSLLETVFKDGVITKETSLDEIRERITSTR